MCGRIRQLRPHSLATRTPARRLQPRAGVDWADDARRRRCSSAPPRPPYPTPLPAVAAESRASVASSRVPPTGGAGGVCRDRRGARAALGRGGHLPARDAGHAGQRALGAVGAADLARPVRRAGHERRCAAPLHVHPCTPPYVCRHDAPPRERCPTSPPKSAPTSMHGARIMPCLHRRPLLPNAAPPPPPRRRQASV